MVRNVSAPETVPKGGLTVRVSKGDENDVTKVESKSVRNDEMTVQKESPNWKEVEKNQ